MSSSNSPRMPNWGLLARRPSTDTSYKPRMPNWGDFATRPKTETSDRENFEEAGEMIQERAAQPILRVHLKDGHIKRWKPTTCTFCFLPQFAGDQLFLFCAKTESVLKYCGVCGAALAVTNDGFRAEKHLRKCLASLPKSCDRKHQGCMASFPRKIVVS